MTSEHIKIGDVTPWIQYLGDGSQTEFDFAFPIFENADLQVYLGASAMPETTGYTVTGAGSSSGGMVNFAVPPASGQAVTLQRNVGIRRVTDFSESGDFRASVINTELDRLTAVAQQLNNRLDRAVRLADTDLSGTVRLPVAAERAGRLAAFDAAGNLIAAAVKTGEMLVTPFVESLLDDVDAGSARETLGAQAAAGALDEISALDPAEGDLLQRGPGGWALRGEAALLGTLRADLRLQALAIAGLQGERANMVDGIADPFGDEADVDAASSSGQSFHIQGGYFYGAAMSGAAADAKIGSNTTSVSGGAPKAYSVYMPSATQTVTHIAVDIHAVGTAGNCVFRLLPNNGSGTILGQTGSVGVSLGLNSYRLNAPVTLTAGTDYLIEMARSSGSFTLSSVASPASNTSFSFISSVEQTLIVNNSNVDAGEHLRFGVRSPTAFTVVSQSFTADAQPDTALFHLQAIGMEAFTVNTDLIADVSRDGGVSWTQAALAKTGALADGTMIFEDKAVDLSAQPPGLALRYRLRVPTAKEIQLHGALLQWG